MVTAQQTLVLVDLDQRKACPIPESYVERLREFEGADLEIGGPGVSADVYRGALEAVERILNRGGDADDVLRAVVAAIQERVPHFTWVGIAFMEEGRSCSGRRPASGDGEELRALVTFEGAPVAELVVQRTEAADDQPFLDRVATLVSPYCLVGWDTQGVPWADVS